MLRAILDSRTLRNAIATLARIAPNRLIPHACLTADDESATLSVTLAGAQLSLPLPLSRVDVPGSVMLPMERVGMIAKSTKGNYVDVESDGPDRVILRTEEPRSGIRATFTLATVAPDAQVSFPRIPGADSSWCVSADDLAMAINRVRHASGSDPRYALEGIAVELDGPRVALVATDARRLARQEIPGTRLGSLDASGPPFTPILPDDCVKGLVGVLKAYSGSNVAMEFATTPNTGPAAEAGLDPEPIRWARIRCNDLSGAEFVVRLSDGTFPEWRKVLPDRASLESRCTVRVADLSRSVLSAKLGTTPEAPGIRLDGIGHGDGALQVSAGGVLSEAYADDVSGSFGVTLDVDYLSDVCKSLGSKSKDSLTIRASTAVDDKSKATPTILETVDGFLALLMPIIPPVAQVAPEADSDPEPEPLPVALDLSPGDWIAWSSPNTAIVDSWIVVGPHPTNPACYRARRKYSWGLGNETTINPVGACWSILSSGSDPTPDASTEPVAIAPEATEVAPSDPEPEPVTKPKRARKPRKPKVAPEAEPLPEPVAIDPEPEPDPDPSDPDPTPGPGAAPEAPAQESTLVIGGYRYGLDAFTGPDGYRVARVSNADGATYDVSEGPDRVSCECPHFVRRLADLQGQVSCKHIAAAIRAGLVSQPDPVPIPIPGPEATEVAPEPEPEPLPVAQVAPEAEPEPLPVTYGAAIPRVRLGSLGATHRIRLREPEPIGHPRNTTVADAGAPAIGLSSLRVDLGGLAEPMFRVDTGAAPEADWPTLGTIRELADDAPIGDPDPEPRGPEPEPDRSAEAYASGSRSALSRQVAPARRPEPRARTRGGLSLAESIDSEADRLESRGTGAGRLMARSLRELAESVRWSGATTPDEHEARMALWDEWAVDNEPRESVDYPEWMTS